MVPIASRMAQHAAALGASDECAVQLADICGRADVKLLRYPVPVERQSPGQTMAMGHSRSAGSVTGKRH